MDASQKDFEDAAFNQRFLSSIKRTGLGGPLELASQDCPMMAEFVAKKPDGTYIEDSLNIAWWGYQAAIKAVQKEADAKQPDGGPAFPIGAGVGNLEDWKHGVSVRDYFAAHAPFDFGDAVMALDNHDNAPGRDVAVCRVLMDDDKCDAAMRWLVMLRFNYADAMLKERP